MSFFNHRSSPIALLLLLAVGCTSRPTATVRLNSANGAEMTQEFTRAAFTQSNKGEYDIILVDQTVADSPTGKGRSKPLASADLAPLTHILHVRVLWRPTRTIRGDSPTATNASVHWTVLGDNGSRIDYTGAGFAQVYGDENQIRVTLRNIHITPNQTRGDLSDPIGAATLASSFKARRDAAFVGSALAAIRPPTEGPRAGGNGVLGYEGPPGRTVSP